ncbi:glycosyltransferase family 87 protein [Ramlibacter humi]|uniref:DUF2029 domain-containing protein n=1 Tax=Ramlibacter humi TaxID=2530451 RepID=A0A4Z0BQ71_9BURK|nr:glycosyltransferase family 87 protein [Ramlibacter humi]TFZ00195.1 DUF2029 domain-containing protein [Ramlibacter humi]
MNRDAAMGPAASAATRALPSMRGLRGWATRWRIEWMVVVLLPLALAAAMQVAGEASLLRYLREWLRMSAWVDSWAPMERALPLMRQAGVRAYDVLFFGEGVKFQYPPTSLVVHELAARMGWPLTVQGLNLVNWFLVWVYAALCGVFGWRLAASSHEGKADRAMAGVLAACMVVLSYPVIKAFTLGQVQLLLDVAFVAACLAWLGGRKFACGALVGAICLVKPQFSLFLVWALLRGQWRFLGGWAVVVAAGLALSLSFFGWRNHFDYLRVLGALSATGETYYPNQSVNGILNRLFGTAPVTTWQANGFPAYHPWVHAVTFASSLLLIGVVLLLRRHTRPRLLDFQAAALAFTIASPIAWEHHYGILPPMLVALDFALGRETPHGSARGACILLAACCLLAGTHLGIAHHAQTGPATLLHSYLFAAALGVLWLLLRHAPKVAPHARHS